MALCVVGPLCLCLLTPFMKICGACDAGECDAEGLEACGWSLFFIVLIGLIGSVNITILVYGWPNAFGELQPDNFP